MSVAAAGPLLALAITRSPIAAGYVTAASVLPGLLLHVPAGSLVDKIDRRKVMLVSQLVRMASALAAFTCLTSSCDPVLILVVAALIDGSCAVFYEVAEIVVVPDLVSKRSLNAAIGSNEAKLNASMLLGRPLGGALLTVSPVMPWLVAVVTSAFPVIALAVMRGPKRRISPPERVARPSIAEVGGEAAVVGEHGAKAAHPALRDALVRLLSDPFSRAMLVVCVMANSLFQVIVLLQIVLAEERGMPSYLVGLFLSFSGLGGFLGAIGAPWILRRKSSSVSVRFCVLVWVALVWIATAWGDPRGGLAMWGLCSVIGAHINVALRVHQAKVFPNELQGRIIGITRLLSVGSVALGAFGGGWLIGSLGVDGTSVLVVVAFSAIVVILAVALHFEALCELIVAAAYFSLALIFVIAYLSIDLWRFLVAAPSGMRQLISKARESPRRVDSGCMETG